MRTIVLLLVIANGLAAQEEPVRTLEADKIDYFLSAAFARYGHEPAKTIGIGRSAVRMRLEKTPAGASQAGIYSHFTLTGDFQFSADFNVVSLPIPKEGYGMSIGLAADTNSPAGAVFVSRSSHTTWGQCLIVTREIVGKEGKTYDSTPFPLTDLNGRIGLRREGSAIISESFDWRGTPKELKRFDDFGVAPIRQLRFFGDSGGDANLVDGWFGRITVAADSILGAPTPPDPATPWATWLLRGSALLAIGGGILLVRRKWRDRHED